ncbi:MAG: transposase [Chloroflexi bacterium]|nr:transposase [Chloroflexota bacterium]
MPYEYRKLSPKEREEIVELRRQKGYPLHAPPHPFRGIGSYLITAANFEHKDVMDSPERRTEFQEILLGGFREIEAEIVGWVILPNHYHVLATVETLDRVSIVIRLIHGRTSRKWNLQDGLTRKRRVWYRFSDRRMRNEVQLSQAFNYVHYNPVKHGYVKDVRHWQWSSLFLYEDELGGEWLKEQWRKFSPPADFGKGWDD